MRCWHGCGRAIGGIVAQETICWDPLKVRAQHNICTSCILGWIQFNQELANQVCQSDISARRSPIQPQEYTGYGAA